MYLKSEFPERPPSIYLSQAACEGLQDAEKMSRRGKTRCSMQAAEVFMKVDDVGLEMFISVAAAVDPRLVQGHVHVAGSACNAQNVGRLFLGL